MSDLSIQIRLREHMYRLMLAKDLSRRNPEKMERLQRLPLFEVAVLGVGAVGLDRPTHYRAGS